ACSADRRPEWCGSGTVPEASTSTCGQNAANISYVRRPNRTVSKFGISLAASFACSLSGTTQSRFPSQAAKYPSAVTQLNVTIRRAWDTHCPRVAGARSVVPLSLRARLKIGDWLAIRLACDRAIRPAKGRGSTLPQETAPRLGVELIS